MFEGFEHKHIATSGTTINLVQGGNGPGLLLLHGYPQTHAMWHKIAPRLARDFTVVVPDLRGYGDSGKPHGDPEHRTYSKRSMAQDQVEVMQQLGFETFRLVGHDRGARVSHRLVLDHPQRVQQLVVRKRLYRAQMLTFIAQLPPTLSGMEACGVAQDWARRLREHGPEVRLLAPPCVTPYRKANKNDLRDAEAIAEAVTRPTMRFVPGKSVAQHELQALQRVRERLMKARTALINVTRGLLPEYGLVVPQGVSTFRQHVLEKLATEATQLTPSGLTLFQQLREALAALEAGVATSDAQLTQGAQTHPVCQRLLTMPGLGELTATALVATVSDAAPFTNGCQCAAWLELVPQPHSTGGKGRLLGISKHGDSSRRHLLVHGARSCLRWVGRKPERRSQWVRSLLERWGWNRAAVALANTNARVAWALLCTEQVYWTVAA